MSTHETFRRDDLPRGGTDRNFGFVFAAFFTIVALYPLVRHRPVRVWALAAAACFLIAALIARVLAAPDDATVAAAVKADVEQLCQTFPLYQGRTRS